MTSALTPWRDWRATAVLAALAVGVQLYGLYRVAGPPTPPWFRHADKLEHGLGFALPTALVLVAVGRRAEAGGGGLSRRTPAVVAAIFGAHAVVSEVVQGTFYTTRSADPFDVLADAVGIAVGVAAGLALLRTSRRRPRP